LEWEKKRTEASRRGKAVSEENDQNGTIGKRRQKGNEGGPGECEAERRD
jgi:hypothetical protein